MRKLMIVKAAVMAASFALAGIPLALAHEGEDHTAEAPAAAAAPATKTLPMVAGEVTKVDAEQSKLSIKHAAIPNLGMDPMTMVFKSGDPAMLKDLKAGDKINFTADKVNGQLTATKVEKAK
jgi:Cu(I)/Ag(I) efflux system periplasmic protein CusF